MQTAVSRGIPYGTVVRRHVLRNAAIPITTIAGLTIASLIALSAVVETRLQPQRPRLLPRAGRRSPRTSRSSRASRSCSWWPFVVVNTLVDLALRPARPAGRAREPRPVSIPVGSACRPARSRAGPAAARRPARRLARGDGCPDSGRRVIGVAIIVLAVLLAIFGPLLRAATTRTRPTSPMPTSARPAATCSASTAQGRDLLSRLLAGARTSCSGARSSSLVAVAIGVERWPSPTAWFGGRLRHRGLGGARRPLRVPGILLAVLAAAVFGPSLLAAGARARRRLHALRRPRAARRRPARAGHARTSRRARCRASALVRSAPGTSSPTSRADRRAGHVLFGYAMVDLAAISFIGLGVQPPQADWGVMVAGGRDRRAAGLSGRVARGGRLHRARRRRP